MVYAGCPHPQPGPIQSDPIRSNHHFRLFQELWLGGKLDEQGHAISSLEGLNVAMAGLGLELVKSQDMPLLIRQHSRLYEYIGVSVWVEG